MAIAQGNPRVYGWNFSFAFDKLSNDAMTTKTLTDEGDMWQLGIEKINSTAVSIHLKLAKVSSQWSDKIRNAQISCFVASKNDGFSEFGGQKDERDADFYGNGDEQISTFHFETEVVQMLEVEIMVTHGLEASTSPRATRSVPNVQELSKTNDFGDVTIVAADGRKFGCHRDVLAIESDVFARMFSSGMKESKENVVNIKDFDGEIVDKMLMFFYVGECGNIGPIADRLYAAAHKYQLEGLKVLCETALAANLSTKSIVKTYRLAKLYNIDGLMVRCDEFVESHKAEMAMSCVLKTSAVKCE